MIVSLQMEKTDPVLVFETTKEDDNALIVMFGEKEAQQEMFNVSVLGSSTPSALVSLITHLEMQMWNQIENSQSPGVMLQCLAIKAEHQALLAAKAQEVAMRLLDNALMEESEEA